MATRCSSLLVLGTFCFLLASPTRADTVLANGLRNTALGFVDLEVTEPVLTQYGYWTPADHAILQVSGLTSLGLEGVDVRLGHAQGGAYFYPWAEAQPGYLMSALSFGSVEGESGRYLASIIGRREANMGDFTAWVDFSPLCLAPYRYRFYSQDQLQREIVTWDRVLRFWSTYYSPRVNPCALNAEGQITAVIDFQNSYATAQLGEELVGITRVEISPATHHRTVDFVSSVQVRGGGGLNSFGLYQVEPFALGFPHRIVGGGSARLEVEPRRAQLSRDSSSSNPLLGLWVEAPPSASLELQLQPGPDPTNEVQLQLEAIGFGALGQGSYVGRATLTLRTNGASLSGRLEICTNQQAVAFRDGVELGATSFSTNSAELEVEGAVGVRAAAVLAHTTNVLAALRFVFDRVAPVALPDGQRFEADEVRIRAGAGASLEFIRRIGLTASNLALLNVTNEIAAPAQTPALIIETIGDQAHLSWLDPNRQYQVQCRAEHIAAEWLSVTNRPMLMNGLATVTLPRMSTEDRFYRLILGPTWDRPMGPGRD